MKQIAHFYGLAAAAILAAAVPAGTAAQPDPAKPAPSLPTAKANPPEVDANKAALTAYIAAINRKDKAAAAAFFAPNVTIDEPYGTPTRSGEAAAAFVKIATSGVVRYELVTPLRASGNAVAAVLKVHAGPVIINAIEVYTFDAQQRITNVHAYFSPSDQEFVKP